ncbi:MULTISPECIES: glycosyltransferase family A protein [unclassified Micromonospora]|uniref:glycosyltransferase family 2 protein n=1 Tax=unclassified Micromonospora TaxID=2617518 RepID=UPI001C602401|nr:glycosyltransferase family A protein [Micromonospora sp. RL09-050-HVF-A]MBW4706074.1 glycosyltransferase family 2 protein [Micromonospora sp. RL09-050-HVF-A]
MTESTAVGQHPPVTVVIATRDRPGLLERAVGAVLGQDYPGPVECIVVYDHTDLRELAVDVPAGRSLRYVNNAHRQGLPGGRNTGADEATADLVAFCDDDDFWLPAKLRRQVELLAQRPDAAAASCGIRLEGPGIAKERQLDRAEVTLPDFVEDRIMEVHSSTILIRRSTWDAIGPVDEELPGGYGEDYEWLLRIAAHGPVVIVPEVLVVVDWHGGSFFFGRWATIVEATRYLLDKHPELAGSRTGLARLHGQIAFALASGRRRREAVRELGRVVRLNPREKRVLVTVPVVLGLLSGERVLRLAQRRGRGV